MSRTRSKSAFSTLAPTLWFLFAFRSIVVAARLIAAIPSAHLSADGEIPTASLAATALIPLSALLRFAPFWRAAAPRSVAVPALSVLAVVALGIGNPSQSILIGLMLAVDVAVLSANAYHLRTRNSPAVSLAAIAGAVLVSLAALAYAHPELMLFYDVITR